MCVIGVLSVWHGATGAAAAEKNKNTEVSQRMMFDSTQRLCHCLFLKCRTCTSLAKYVPWIIFHVRVGPVVRIQLSIKKSALNVAAHSLRSVIPQSSSSIPVHLNGRCLAGTGLPESMWYMIYFSYIRFVSKTELGKIANDLLLAPK